MNRCVSWLALLVYALLVLTSLVGTWLAGINFGDDEAIPPAPPPDYNTSLPGRPYDPSPAVLDYVEKTEAYALLTNDPRFYMMVPCGVALVTSVIFLLGGLCSRGVFNTTASLYTSLGLWIITIISIVGYEDNYPGGTHDIPTAAALVLGILVSVMFLLSALMLLAMWELRRQEAGWPTINFLWLFTLEGVIVVARLALAITIAVEIMNSALTQGVREKCLNGYWLCAAQLFPIWLSISGAVSAAYSIVVSGETLLSYFLGIYHKHVIWSTSLISALSNSWIAVLVSPVFIKSYIGPYWMYTELMIICIVTSILTFIHTIACLAVPSLLRTPPRFITKIAEKISAISLSSVLDSGYATFTTGIQRRPGERNTRFTVTPSFWKNLISCVVSVFMIILLTSEWWGYMSRFWGMSVLLAVNIAVLYHVLPLFFLQVYYHQDQDIPLTERTARDCMEVTLVLVGSCGTFVSNPDSAPLAAAILQLLYTMLKTFLMVREHYIMWRQRGAGPSDVQVLVEEGNEQAAGVHDQDAAELAE